VAKKEDGSFDVSGDVARNINRHAANTEYIRIQREDRGQSAQRSGKHAGDEPVRQIAAGS